MNTYRSSKELQGKTLESGDLVIFSISGLYLKYRVLSTYLSISAIDNDTILKKLGILNARQYVSKLYGYECGYGCWPEYNYKDFKAITHVVMDLFRRCEESNLPKDNEFTFTIEDIPKSCPYHPYVIDQALVEFAKGIDTHIPSVKAAFDYFTNNYITCWFQWSDTSQGFEYWENILHENNFVPSEYVPTYFREIPVNNSSKFPIETSLELPKNTHEMSVEIPTSYEETVLSIEEKTVHF